jgi:hypothetical protein
VWSSVAQVVCQGCTGVLGQRQAVNALPLGVHDDLTVLPVQILEPQSADFAGTQSEPGQKQQD